MESRTHVTVTAPIQPPYEFPSADRLALTLFIATALHALVILGVSFEAFKQDPADQNTPTLDITVVKTKNTPPPEEYDYLADSSQDGAGNTAEKIQPQQQMLEQAPPPVASESKPTPTRVLTQDHNSREARNSDPAAPEQNPERASATELINRSMEMLTLNEQINQSLQAYSKAHRASSFRRAPRSLNMPVTCATGLRRSNAWGSSTIRTLPDARICPAS